ncbi:MAG TPA: hypothetical protein VEK77_09935 [Gemmatimonadales bacterium]|nr:hypothetical protein [Gemmatimonadales bacterium]HYU09687.1 hypothetical protein [Gemmatimonadales bacterium]
MRRVAFLLYVLAVGCRGNAAAADEQDMAAPEQHPDEHAAAAAERAMAGMVAEDLHLRLTPLRPVAPGDSARAAEVLAVMRRELARYRDVRVAQGDGFRQFIPAGGAPVQHFTKLRWALQARNGLDPARPTSLLYERAADGNLTLVGAMFTAPPQTTDDELNARLPLSVARWHQHVNWCLPGGPLADARRRWRETRDGQPVFGPKSPIATAEACDAVGGRFRPRLFGWMVHVMAFSADDPWNAHHH